MGGVRSGIQGSVCLFLGFWFRFLCLLLSWDHKRKTLSVLKTKAAHTRTHTNMWAWGSGRARGLAEATMPPNETANRKEQAREWEKKHGHNNKSTTISSNNEDNITGLYCMR